MAAPANPAAPQTPQQTPAAPAPAPGQPGGNQASSAAPTESASSSGPPDTYVPVPQTVPAADPGQVADAQASAAEGRKNFPTAAAAAVGIVAGIIALFVAYRAYRWWTKRKASRASALPVMHETGTGSGKSTYLSPYESAGYSYPDSTSSFKVPRHQSSASVGAYDEPPSPNTPSAGSGRPLLDSRESTDALRKIGSRQSLQAFGGVAAPNRASYMSGTSGGNRSSYAAPRPVRYSGAPHSIHSRVEIAVPQPLGAPPGNVVATDSTTLQFATDMGSGSLGAVEVPEPRGPTPPSASASGVAPHQPYAFAAPAPQPHHRSRVISLGGQSVASSAGASVSAAQRAAYLAHGHRPSSAAFRDPSSTESSSHDDTSSSDDGGIMGKMRGPMQPQRMQPMGTHTSSSGSISGMGETEPYRAPSAQLDEILSER